MKFLALLFIHSCTSRYVKIICVEAESQSCHFAVRNIYCTFLSKCLRSTAYNSELSMPRNVLLPLACFPSGCKFNLLFIAQCCEAA
jgi:hypothetical protein